MLQKTVFWTFSSELMLIFLDNKSFLILRCSIISFSDVILSGTLHLLRFSLIPVVANFCNHSFVANINLELFLCLKPNTSLLVKRLLKPRMQSPWISFTCSTGSDSNSYLYRRLDIDTSSWSSFSFFFLNRSCS